MINLLPLLKPAKSQNTIIMMTVEDLQKIIDETNSYTRQVVENATRPVYLTRKEVMEILNISNGTFYNFVRDGKLHPVMVGEKTRFVRSEIDEAVQTGKLAKYQSNK